jgi:hypothetical protein
MGYRLLGLVVWKGAKWYLGRRIGSSGSGRAKAAMAAGALAVAAGVLLFGLKRGSGD